MMQNNEILEENLDLMTFVISSIQKRHKINRRGIQRKYIKTNIAGLTAFTQDFAEITDNQASACCNENGEIWKDLHVASTLQLKHPFVRVSNTTEYVFQMPTG